MSRYRPKLGAEQALATLERLQAYMKSEGERVATQVRSVAPKGRSGIGKRYVDMIEVDVGILRGQLVARVNANKFTAVFLELGTGPPGPTPVFAPLRRGAEAADYRLLAKR